MNQVKSFFELPVTSTGSFQIRGCIDVDGCTEEAEDGAAAFFGIYAQDAHGLHFWVEDFNTRAQASDVVKYLQSSI